MQRACLVMPGLIDLHVHFQRSGTDTEGRYMRLVHGQLPRGGVTTVVAMPNTTPSD